MNRENLIQWVNRHFYQPEQEKNNEITVSCPFHSNEKNICKCHICLDTQKYYCDTSIELSNISLLFKHFHEDFPKNDKYIQINNHYYTNKRGKYMFTLVESLKPDGTKMFYQRPKGVKANLLFNLPRVIKSVEEQKVIVFLVGESNVKKLKRYGITATTIINGTNINETIIEALIDIPKEAKILFYGNDIPKYRQYFEKVSICLNRFNIIPKVLEDEFLDFDDIDYWIKDGNKKIDVVFNKSKKFIISKDKYNKITSPQFDNSNNIFFR